MTDQPPASPDPQRDSSSTPRRGKRILGAIAIAGTSLVVLGGAAYFGISTWVYRHLPGTLEAELEKLLDREVVVGDVESFSFTNIRLGATAIPASPTDPDRVSVEELDLTLRLLPLLTRTLHLDITLDEPVLYVEQEPQDGTWLDLDIEAEEGSELPFGLELDATVRLKNARAAFLPIRTRRAIALQANGELQVTGGAEQQTFRYDADVIIGGGTATIQGETLSGSAATKANLRAQSVNLTTFNPLVASLPIDLPLEVTDGAVSANLRVDLPSIKTLPSVYGTAQLQQVTAEVEQLPQPVTVEGTVRFLDQVVSLEPIQAQIENTLAELDGTVDLNQGYDLAISVPALDIEEALTLAAVTDLPAEVGGVLDANLQVSGELLDPQVQGRIGNVNQTQLDQIALDQLQVDFQANLARLVLDNLTVVPTVGGEIRASGFAQFESFTDFLANPVALDLEVNRLPADAIADLYQATSPQVRYGTLSADGRISGSLNNLAGNVNWRLPDAAIASVGEVTGVGEILLAGPDLQIRNTQLEVGQGQIAVTGQGRLDTTEWQADIEASNLVLADVPAVRSALQPSPVLVATTENKPATAQLRLSGRLDSLLDETPSLTVNADAIAAQLGEQSLTATGDIRLEPSTGAEPWTLATVLDVTAQSDLASLPRSVLREQVNVANVDLDLQGLARFSGRFQGRNLLGDLLAADNLDLTGELQLANLAVNQIAFDPLLSGQIAANPGQQIELDLQGVEQVGVRDRIAARLVPCQADRCFLPYLLDAFDFRQGEQVDTAILASGTRQGEQLNVDIDNFALSILGLSPARPVGIQDPLAGQVTGNVNLNLFTLAATGTVNVENPGIAYLTAREFGGSFAYADGIAELTEGSLRLRNSRAAGEDTLYALRGGLNFNTGAIEGEVDIVRGYIQDLLLLTQWFTIADLRRGLQPLPDTNAAAIATAPRSNPNAPLASQIKLLLEILNQLNQLAAMHEQFEVPSLLDIEGQYTGGVTVAGTLSNPRTAFNFTQSEQTDWVWYPNRGYPVVKVESASDTSTVQNAKLRIAEARSLRVTDVVLSGGYVDGALVIDPETRVELEEAAVAQFGGRLSPQSASADFSLSNLTVDVIESVVAVPVDLAGTVNAAGRLQGSLTQPQVNGSVEFVDLALNQEPLDPILGDFGYADSRLRFVTQAGSLIEARADLPIPPAPGNDQFVAEVLADTDVFQLVGGLTNNQVRWVGGEARANLLAQGRLNFSAAGLQSLAATGQVDLDEATLAVQRTQPFILDEQVVADGQVLLENDRIRVNELVGQFAGGEALISGVLPLLTPMGLNDPDAATPLTVTVDEQQLEIDHLYDGEVDSEIVLTGSALAPLVSGNVTLYDGEVSIPERATADDDDVDSDDPDSTAAAIAAVTPRPAEQRRFAWTPIFNDFQVVLGDDFGLDNFPLYSVRLEGPIALNGTLNNLVPDGQIELTRARVNLFSNQFYLTRARDHTITFRPNRGLFNPAVDVQLVTTALEPFSIRRQEVSASEIRDDIIPNVRPETVEIFLTVDGFAQQLIPALGATGEMSYCSVRSQETFLADSLVTADNLGALEDCIVLSALSGTGNASDTQVLQSSVTSLTSMPQRSESQIVALLGNQLLTFAEDVEQVLRDGDEGDIIGFAATEFVVRPALRGFLRDVDDFTDSVGEEVGLSQLRVIPILRATRRLNEDEALDFQYDYEFGQFRVQYRLRF